MCIASVSRTLYSLGWSKRRAAAAAGGGGGADGTQRVAAKWRVEWFRRVVSDRRGLAGEPLAKVTDGRIFTGQQALDLKLIDEIGGEKQAVAWLEREKGVDKDLPIREWKRSTTTEFGLWSAAAAVSEAAGLEGLARALQSAGRGIEQPSLDGLLAVWQP